MQTGRKADSQIGRWVGSLEIWRMTDTFISTFVNSKSNQQHARRTHEYSRALMHIYKHMHT